MEGAVLRCVRKTLVLSTATHACSYTQESHSHRETRSPRQGAELCHFVRGSVDTGSLSFLICKTETTTVLALKVDGPNLIRQGVENTQPRALDYSCKIVSKVWSRNQVVTLIVSGPEKEH